MAVLVLADEADRAIARQAAQWLDLLKSGHPDRHEAFMDWVSASPRHMEAFLSLLALTQTLREMAGSGGFAAASAAAGHPATPPP